MNMAGFLRLAALVVFIVAAVLAFLTSVNELSVLGWVSVGLAAWVGSTLAP